MIWDYINAKRFFENYCPEVKNYKHKIRGYSGRGKPISFTDEDKKLIRKALKEMIAEKV